MNKLPLLLFAVCLLGCSPKTVPAPTKHPCEPSVTDQMARHPAAITERSAEDHHTSWRELHRITCGDNESDVLPSIRMYDYAYDHFANDDDREKWLAEHTYCIPDGLKEKP
jgi:hypothetical protein